ncbi:MAG: hypothetical protein A2Y10_10270 [Planctomycetes bacterium GWF2_41_51]|nr:MAG: hypothetical protein A2Y10_10270 [Planctomycetes bacterium GWF2_41_51]HBG27674.1 hypothetical protein [Phycisphaerales bacterium]
MKKFVWISKELGGCMKKAECFLIVVTILSGLVVASSPVPDYLYTQGVPFDMDSHITSTTVFQWFVSDGGQVSGPWAPMEGRAAWTGEPDWWQSQIKQMMLADIDVIYVHVARPLPLIGGDWYSPLRRKLLTALSQMREAGYDVPKVVPYLDLACTGTSFNVATSEGKDGFVGEYTAFYNDYFATNPDQYADSYLAQIDGRVVLMLYELSTLVNPGSLSRYDVESRLAANLGANHPVFNDEVYLIGNSPAGTYLSWSDERVWNFGIASLYYYATNHNNILSVVLKGGYWDQNINTPGNFLPRDGGVHFRNAWNSVLANSDIDRVYVEGWNEYDEGSGIYAANTGDPYIVSPNPNTDTWSSTNDPFEYIHTTASGARQFNDYPDLDSKILWNNIPSCMAAGQQYTAYVVVRNQGDLLWNEANQFRFSQKEADSTLFGVGGQTRWTIDDVSNEVPLYGGVFRGRPVTFELHLQAPATVGTYSTHWGMVQDGGAGRFGEELTKTIKVFTDPSFFQADLNGDCSVDMLDLKILVENWLK